MEDYNLTNKEKKAISAFKSACKKLDKEGLWVFSFSGTLLVIKNIDDRGYMIAEGSVKNDGGDPDTEVDDDNEQYLVDI